MMAVDLANTQTAVLPDVSSSAVSWPAIFAGAVIAIAVTLILITLGSGFGAAALSPWPGVGPTATTFSIATGLWLIVTQWISSGVGGYLTGRLRTRWVGTHTHEVFFRDTAHGFLAWAVATVVVAGLAALAASATAGAGIHAAAAVVSGSGAADTSDMAMAAADAARKAAAALSIFTGLSMLVGAFIACIAAALGGQQRDEHP
jgi:hypothetical protein